MAPARPAVRGVRWRAAAARAATAVVVATASSARPARAARRAAPARGARAQARSTAAGLLAVERRHRQRRHRRQRWWWRRRRWRRHDGLRFVGLVGRRWRCAVVAAARAGTAGSGGGGSFGVVAVDSTVAIKSLDGARRPRWRGRSRRQRWRRWRRRRRRRAADRTAAAASRTTAATARRGGSGGARRRLAVTVVAAAVAHRRRSSVSAPRRCTIPQIDAVGRHRWRGRCVAGGAGRDRAVDEGDRLQLLLMARPRCRAGGIAARHRRSGIPVGIAAHRGSASPPARQPVGDHRRARQRSYRPHRRNIDHPSKRIAVEEHRRPPQLFAKPPSPKIAPPEIVSEPARAKMPVQPAAATEEPQLHDDGDDEYAGQRPEAQARVSARTTLTPSSSYTKPSGRNTAVSIDNSRGAGSSPRPSATAASSWVTAARSRAASSSSIVRVIRSAVSAKRAAMRESSTPAASSTASFANASRCGARKRRRAIARRR